LEVIMRHRYRLLVAAVLVAAGVLVGGCSSASGGTPVASLSGHAAVTQSGQALSQPQSDQDMISFARCMRSHGVQMSDPVHRPGHAGLSIDLPTRDSATSAAYAACTHFIQAIIDIKMAGAASQAAPELPALTRYAQCMRGHGINLLDPTPQGEVNMGPGDFGRYSPQFRAADTACRHFLPAGIRDDGTGP
jgi:hypothetical protein